MDHANTIQYEYHSRFKHTAHEWTFLLKIFCSVIFYLISPSFPTLIVGEKVLHDVLQARVYWGFRVIRQKTDSVLNLF